MLLVADIAVAAGEALLRRYGLSLQVQPEAETIRGSYWGDAEAGVRGTTVFVRHDTPVHSLLHESCHIICMSAERRRALDTDAGGDDLEEAAVCYLQIILADRIDGVGRDRVMADMDAWGYSFRLGNTRSWFRHDAEDARNWLIGHDLLDHGDAPTYKLRA